MKLRKSNFIICIVIGMFISGSFEGHTQSKKNRARISLDYESNTGHLSYLMITAKFRGSDGFEPAAGMNFDVYQVLERDSLVNLGKTTTQANGIAKFELESISTESANEDGEYFYLVVAKENNAFEDVEKSINFKRAELVAIIEEVGDSNHVVATLTDLKTNSPIIDQPLIVRVQRLFKPLRIGPEVISTDEFGMISVPVDKNLPGLNGNLTIEVVLSESDTYGTMRAIIKEPIGTPIVDTSTFDERTMWSPPGKTPLFLLIFPNLMIIGIWATIVLLLFNLYKINKSKP